MTPDQKAHTDIDRLLGAVGWAMMSIAEAKIHASRGIAIREFRLQGTYGFADHLLYVDGKAAG